MNIKLCTDLLDKKYKVLITTMLFDKGEILKVDSIVIRNYNYGNNIKAIATFRCKTSNCRKDKYIDVDEFIRSINSILMEVY